MYGITSSCTAVVCPYEELGEDMSDQIAVCDFLGQIGDESLQQAARNILSSYSHVYDVLAEALQNAVDAVEERYLKQPEHRIAKIQVEFDAQSHAITITDTGTGMPWNILSRALAPNVTFKSNTADGGANRRRSRGEKGVGLSFLTFACNHLKITSVTELLLLKGA